MICINLRCVAQFGPSSFGPQHGFARISRWTLERAPERLHNGDIEALFSLMDSEFTRSMWNFPLVLLSSQTTLTQLINVRISNFLFFLNGNFSDFE